MVENPVDTYLLKFPDPQRAALQRTRATIAAALPGAAQVISYGMPTFKVDGVAVVGFDGFKGHNSLFPYSGSVGTLLGSEIPDQVTSKGTVQFPVDKAFPAPLLKRILQVRIQEINACYPKRTGEVKEFYSNGQLKLSGRMKDSTGEVLTGLNKGHTGSDVLKFFKQIDATVPRGLGVHVILDNLSAHSTPEIKKWLAHRDRRRWHLHFTPTSSSWLNLIERWFKELTDRRLRRGTFNSVADLSHAITTWAEHWNIDPSPFIWKATAEDIITKVQRGRETLNQIKSQTDH